MCANGLRGRFREQGRWQRPVGSGRSRQRLEPLEEGHLSSRSKWPRTPTRQARNLMSRTQGLPSPEGPLRVTERVRFQQESQCTKMSNKEQTDATHTFPESAF